MIFYNVYIKKNNLSNYKMKYTFIYIYIYNHDMMT